MMVTQNERRAKARKAGICVECQFNRAIPDRIRCATCLDYQAKRAKAKRAKARVIDFENGSKICVGVRPLARVFRGLKWLFGPAK